MKKWIDTMAGTIFSIDIQDDLITGVLLNINHKATVITGCGVTSIGSRPIEEAVVEIMNQTGFHDGICRISLSAERFFFHNLSLPFTDSRKLRKILPFELEETAPLEINRLLVDTIISNSEGEQANIVAAMVERDFLADRLSRLLALGLDPEIITVSGVPTAVRLMELPDCPPDLVFLDIGLQAATMIVVLNRQIVLIRSLCFEDGGSRESIDLGDNFTKTVPHSPEVYSTIAAAVKQTLLAAQIKEPGMPIYLAGPSEHQRGVSECLADSAGVDIRDCDLLGRHSFLKIAPNIEAKWVPWVMDRALALGMAAKKSRKGFNFRKDAFARKVSLNQYRHLFWKGGAFTAALVVVVGFFLWLSSMSLKTEEKTVTMQIRAVFSETLPTVTRIVDPVQQLQTEINKLKQSTGGSRTGNQYKVLDLLAEISEIIPDSLKVRLTLMSVDEKGIRIKGVTDSFNTVDTVKKKLEKSSYFNSVAISSANLAPKNNEILFELKLQLREI
jgi:general secretion pathway protein L